MSFVINREFYGMRLGKETKRKFFEFISAQVNGDLTFERVDKCLCGSTDSEQIANCDRFGFPVASHLCRKCGLIYLSPRLTEKSLPYFYDKLYWGLVQGRKDDVSPDSLMTGEEGNMVETAQFLSTYFSKGQSIKVAEIGTGNGQKLLTIKQFFKSKGIEVDAYGCDYSLAAVTAAQKAGIKAIQGDFALLSNQGPFDLVIMSHVVEHLNHPVDVLSKVSQLLAPQGKFYVEVPGVGDLDKKEEYGFDFFIYSVIAHTYCFNLASLRSTVEAAGFEMLDGTEFVRSVFKKNEKNLGAYKIDPSNYKRVVEALMKAEQARSMKFNSFKQRLKSTLRKVTGYEIYRD